MEILSNPVVVIVLGAVMTGLTQLSKKLGLNHKIFLAFVSLIVAGGYVWFTKSVGADLQAELTKDFGAIVGYATMIYHFFVKNEQK